MRTLETDTGTVFISHGDRSGNVEINRGGISVEVPADDLKRFVAEWVRDERISQIEQAADDDLLGLK